MISIDKKGKVLLFYSAIRPMSEENRTPTNPFGTTSDWSGTITVAARYDLSNLNDIKCEFASRMGVDGMLNTTGAHVPTTTNGDYVYDEANKRILSISEPQTVNILDVSNDAVLGDTFRDNDYSQWAKNGIHWTGNIPVVPSQKTVYPLASNNGFVRDPYGWTVASDKIDVAITGMPQIASNGVDHIWGYRIIRKTVTLP